MLYLSGNVFILIYQSQIVRMAIIKEALDLGRLLGRFLLSQIPKTFSVNMIL